MGSKKSQIVHWLRADHAISPPSGRMLAEAFRILGREVPDDWFDASSGREMTWHDQMREIAEQSTQRYHEEVQKLRRQVERLRKEQAAMREEVLEEIRRLREAS